MTILMFVFISLLIHLATIDIRLMYPFFQTFLLTKSFLYLSNYILINCHVPTCNTFSHIPFLIPFLIYFHFSTYNSNSSIIRSLPIRTHILCCALPSFYWIIIFHYQYPTCRTKCFHNLLAIFLFLFILINTIKIRKFNE